MRRPSGSRPASRELPHEIVSKIAGDGEGEGEVEVEVEVEVEGNGEEDGELVGEGGVRLEAIQLARSLEVPRS
jgi:hypothetical protein